MFNNTPYFKTALWVGFFIIIIYFTVNIERYPFIQESEFNYFVPITYTENAIETYTADLKSATNGALLVEVGVAGDLEFIKTEPDILTHILVPQGITEVESRILGSNARVTVADKENVQMNLREVGYYKIGLNPIIPWDLEISTGVISGEMDLRGILLNSLHINTGAGEMTIRVDKITENATLSIDSGVASIALDIHKDIGIYVEQSAFVHSNDFDSEWTKRFDGYVSNNYDEAVNKVRIELNSAVSELKINH